MVLEILSRRGGTAAAKRREGKKDRFKGSSLGTNNRKRKNDLFVHGGGKRTEKKRERRIRKRQKSYGGTAGTNYGARHRGKEKNVSQPILILEGEGPSPFRLRKKSGDDEGDPPQKGEWYPKKKGIQRAREEGMGGKGEEEFGGAKALFSSLKEEKKGRRPA